MLRSQLNDALKKAVLAKDACSVTTVRLILAALKNAISPHGATATPMAFQMMKSSICFRRW